jgi:hypothetical protein
MALRDLVFYNFRWKGTALLLAILVWLVIKFTIASGRNQELLRQPVMVLTAPDDPRTFRVQPPEVDVVVQSVRELQKQDLQAFVDLTAMPDVNSTFKQVSVRAPEGTKVVRIQPSPVVSVERIAPLDLSLTNSLDGP